MIDVSLYAGGLDETPADIKLLHSVMYGLSPESDNVDIPADTMIKLMKTPTATIAALDAYDLLLQTSTAVDAPVTCTKDTCNAAASKPCVPLNFFTACAYERASLPEKIDERPAIDATHNSNQPVF